MFREGLYCRKLCQIPNTTPHHHKERGTSWALCFCCGFFNSLPLFPPSLSLTLTLSLPLLSVCFSVQRSVSLRLFLRIFFSLYPSISLSSLTHPSLTFSAAMNNICSDLVAWYLHVTAEAVSRSPAQPSKPRQANRSVRGALTALCRGASSATGTLWKWKKSDVSHKWLKNLIL